MAVGKLLCCFVFIYIYCAFLMKNVLKFTAAPLCVIKISNIKIAVICTKTSFLMYIDFNYDMKNLKSHVNIYSKKKPRLCL